MLETTVLVVDPTVSDCEETAGLIRSGFPEGTVLTAGSQEDAVEQLSRGNVDAVVTRYDIGDATGLELTATVRDRWPETDCFLYAETTDIETETFEDAVVEFVPKDSHDAPETLLTVIKQADTMTGQTTYPLPENEGERLAVVDQYLKGVETVADSLDRIADLAKRHFDVQGAAITVITEGTQEALAANGNLSLPSGRQESVGTHTLVHEESVMGIEDTRKDPRITDRSPDPAVSYLGAKIRSRDGHVIGALSLYDDASRTYSPAERAYLSTLAELTGDVLELSRALGDGNESPTAGESL